MKVELLGGPLDGIVCDHLQQLPPFLILPSNGEGVLYRRGCCGNCTVARKKMPYFFAGYSYEDETTVSGNDRSSVRVNSDGKSIAAGANGSCRKQCGSH